jgi:hypothetical protein
VDEGVGAALHAAHPLPASAQGDLLQRGGSAPADLLQRLAAQEQRQLEAREEFARQAVRAHASARAQPQPPQPPQQPQPPQPPQPPPPPPQPGYAPSPVGASGVREANRARLLLAFIRDLQSKTNQTELPAEKVAKLARHIEAHETELFQSRQP